MRRTSISFFLSLCCSITLTSCQDKHDGAVEGMVVPPGFGVRITISQSGKTVHAVDANARDGKFRIALAPGKYDVSVSAPASPFPVTIAGINVDPGKTATLPSVEIAQLSGTAALSGIVSPGGPGTKVTLLYEGRERASMAAAPDGRYEFTALPEGKYTIMASSPGYASDSAEIRLSGDRGAAQNIRLLYETPIDGIDWTRGVIHARGKGLYPANSANHTAMLEMARRAALSEAERNLLRIIEQIKLAPNRDMKSVMTTGTVTVRIKGYLQGFKISNEREVDGGVEIELELPLTGPGGLTRSIYD